MSEALVQVLYFLENVSVYIFRVQAIGLVSNSVLGFIVFVYLSRIKIVNQKSFSEEIFKICFPLIWFLFYSLLTKYSSKYFKLFNYFLFDIYN